MRILHLVFGALVLFTSVLSTLAQSDGWSDWARADRFGRVEVSTRCTGDKSALWDVQVRGIGQTASYDINVQPRDGSLVAGPATVKDLSPGNVFAFEVATKNCKDIHLEIVARSSDREGSNVYHDFHNGKIKAHISNDAGGINWGEAVAAGKQGAASGMNRPSGPTTSSDGEKSRGSNAANTSESDNGGGRIAITNLRASSNSLSIGQYARVQFTVTDAESAAIKWSFECDGIQVQDAHSTGPVQRDSFFAASGGTVAPGSVIHIVVLNRHSQFGVATCTVRASAPGSAGATQAQAFLRFTVGQGP